MDSGYDEDLLDNVFFQMLKKDYCDVFFKATLEGCVFCVPRAGSLPKYLLTLDDFLNHILIPSDELPESHFRSLSGKEVKISNQVVTVEQDVGHQLCTHILFEETFYTEDYLKYKVLCIEQPLEQKSEGSHVNSNIITLRTLRDCMDMLWIESGNKDVIESIDEAVSTFLLDNPNIESGSLQTIKDSVGWLYAKCVQIVLKDPRLKEKTVVNKHLLENLKTAVETYMNHGIYQKVIKGVSTCMAYEDAQLNKIIRNLSDLQIRDLGIRQELHDTIPRAKTELARIDGYSTVLGKLGCLKKVMTAISKQPVGGNVIAADDLLPILVFLVVKTGLANWHAQLTYLKLFRCSVSSYFHNDEGSFLVTSLEAAVQHIQSGVLLGPSCPEGQGEGADTAPPPKTPFHSAQTMSEFFHHISLGHLEEVRRILARGKGCVVDYGDLDLCHPLCDCPRCTSRISQTLCDTTPTVHSRDERGLSPLHIAAMYGRPKLVDYLLACGADPNASDHLGLTAIHYTALRGHQNALLLLAHSGADINASDTSRNTPLHLCSNNGHEGSVKALIYFSEHVGIKLRVNAQNVNGDTALHHAARWGYLSIVKALLENRARPGIANRRRLTPLDIAHSANVSKLLTAVHQEAPRFVRLKPRSASFDFSDDASDTRAAVQGVRPNSAELIKRVEKLLRAIACGDVNLACFYLSIDPNTLTSPGGAPRAGESRARCHPLCDCEKCVDGEETEPCRKDALDVNMCNSEGLTPLHIAAMHGQLALARVLLRHGATPNAQTRTRRLTPLMLACQNQRAQTAKLLLLSGCAVDLQDAKGNTALHYSCHTCNPRLVELLVKFEPRLDLRNASNKTALHEAEERMSLAIIKILQGGNPLNLNVYASN